MGFSILWGLNIAYLAGRALLSGHELASIHATAGLYPGGILLFNVIVLGLPPGTEVDVDINLLATRKTAATCCNSPAGDCHQGERHGIVDSGS